jgi:hypothetical protein
MAPVLWYGNYRIGLFHEFRQVGARLMGKIRNRGNTGNPDKPSPSEGDKNV